VISRLLICFGFMVIGAKFPNETLATASILWNGVVAIVKQVGAVLA
jgi:hypothetical protein